MYDANRNQYVLKYIEMNRNVTQVAVDETMLMISIFDPLSSKLPANITSNWSSVVGVYNLSRNFVIECRRREKKVMKNWIK